jgi:hypothetical protein
MTTVTIQRERGDPPEALDFIAWKDDRRAFYAYQRDRKRSVVTLIPALPRDAMWIEEPFPECAPVNVAPVYLLPPPCRESRDEWKPIGADEWEIVHLNTHKQLLHLTPDDDAALQDRLEARKATARIEYERGKKALTESSARLDSALAEFKKKQDQGDFSGTFQAILDSPYKQSIPRDLKAHFGTMSPEAQSEGLSRIMDELRSVAMNQIEAHEREYTGSLHTCHGVEFSGTLNMTLGMVKRGCDGIRDAYLVEWWAKRENANLAQMDGQRSDFRLWLQRNAGVPAIIYDARMKDKRRDFVPPRFLGDRDPQFMTLCAAVAFRVEFADGSAAYLTDCPPPRMELRPEEQREVDLVDPDRRADVVSDDKTVKAHPRYVIARRGLDYEISFEGKTFTAKGKGIAYIVTFLRYPNETKDPSALYTESHGAISEANAGELDADEVETGMIAKLDSEWNSDREQARRNVKDGWIRLKRFRQLSEREESKDPKDALADEEVRQLTSLRKDIGDEATFVKYLAEQQAIVDGRKLTTKSEQARKREAMLRSINNTLKNIERPRVPPVSESAREAGKRFADHIRRYLTSQNLKSYDPPPGVEWILP